MNVRGSQARSGVVNSPRSSRRSRRTHGEVILHSPFSIIHSFYHGAHGVHGEFTERSFSILHFPLSILFTTELTEFTGSSRRGHSPLSIFHYPFFYHGAHGVHGVFTEWAFSIFHSPIPPISPISPLPPISPKKLLFSKTSLIFATDECGDYPLISWKICETYGEKCPFPA